MPWDAVAPSPFTSAVCQAYSLHSSPVLPGPSLPLPCHALTCSLRFAPSCHHPAKCPCLWAAALSPVPLQPITPRHPSCATDIPASLFSSLAQGRLQEVLCRLPPQWAGCLGPQEWGTGPARPLRCVQVWKGRGLQQLLATVGLAGGGCSRVGCPGGAAVSTQRQV